MAMNVSEFVWKRLSEWGLKRVYGYPGDGVLSHSWRMRSGCSSGWLSSPVSIQNCGRRA